MDDLLHDLQIKPHFPSEGHDYVYILLRIEETGYSDIHIKTGLQTHFLNYGIKLQMFYSLFYKKKTKNKKTWPNFSTNVFNNLME